MTIAGIALAMCLAASARAEEVRVLSPAQFAGRTMTYAISWNGIPAATARADFRSESTPRLTTHHLDLRSWTLPLLRLIWPAQNEIHSAVRGDLAPLSFSIFRRERWKEQSAAITFDREAELVHIVRTKASGEVKEVTRPLDGLYDPVSLLYMLRQQRTALGSEYEANVVVNDDVYRITVAVVDHGAMRLGRRTVPVVCVTPTAVKIEDDGSEEPLEKVQSVRIWVTDDAMRLPIELSASAFIGRVTMALRSVEPPLDDLYAQVESGVVLAAEKPGAEAPGAKEEG